MNFLAHLYLSPLNQDIIFGNFIADSVKGRMIKDFSEGVQTGIRLHRSIDSFTDSHPVFRNSRARLSPTYNHYSGVIVDIFYDHFLAKYWSDFSDEDLKFFVRKHYCFLISRFRQLPKKSKFILPFMISQNWLVNYSNLDSLERVFNGMDRRTKNKSGMKTAVISLQKDYKLFEADFRKFFPDIRTFVDKKIEAQDY